MDLTCSQTHSESTTAMFTYGKNNTGESAGPKRGKGAESTRRNLWLLHPRRKMTKGFRCDLVEIEIESIIQRAFMTPGFPRRTPDRALGLFGKAMEPQ